MSDLTSHTRDDLESKKTLKVEVRPHGDDRVVLEIKWTALLGDMEQGDWMAAIMPHAQAQELAAKLLAVLK